MTKYSGINTLTHRARTASTKPELLNQEIQHLSKALTKCKYPRWALDKIERTFISNNQKESNEGNNQREQSENNTDNTSGNPEGRDSTKEVQQGALSCTIHARTRRKYKNICKRFGIQTHLKGNRNIKNILVKPKDKDSLDRKSGAIYSYQCGELMCDEECIGKTSRTFGERNKEHLKEPSPIYEHGNISGHSTNLDNFTIIGREDHGLARTIMESIYIRVNNPTQQECG